MTKKRTKKPPGERGVGRPSKLTPEVREEIVEAIKIGNYPEISATAAGVSPRTYYKWMEQGRRKDAKPDFSQFVQDIEKARAFAERADIALIDTAANAGTWQAAAWKRERMNPDRWALRKPEVDVAVDGTVRVIVTYTNDWKPKADVVETSQQKEQA